MNSFITSFRSYIGCIIKFICKTHKDHSWNTSYIQNQGCFKEKMFKKMSKITLPSAIISS